MECDDNSITINGIKYYLTNIDNLPNKDDCILVKNIKVIQKKKISGNCSPIYTLYTEIVKKSTNSIYICIESSIIENLKSYFKSLLNYNNIITSSITINISQIDDNYDFLKLIELLVNYLTNIITNHIDEDKSNTENDKILNSFFINYEENIDDASNYLNELFYLFMISESIVYNKYNFFDMKLLPIYKKQFIKGFYELLTSKIKLSSPSLNSNIIDTIKTNISTNLEKYKENKSLIYTYGFSWDINSCWLDSVFWIIFTNINIAEYFKNNLITTELQINDNSYYFNELNNLITEFYTSNHGMNTRNSFLMKSSLKLFETIPTSTGTADDAFSILFKTYTTKILDTVLILKNSLLYISYTPPDDNIFYLVTFKQNNLSKDLNFGNNYYITGSNDGKELIGIDFFKSDEQDTLLNYDPIGILIHTGSHYTAISKANDDIWYYYDDMGGVIIKPMNNLRINFLNISILFWRKN